MGGATAIIVMLPTYKAMDARCVSGATANLIRTDFDTAAFTYKVNPWMAIINEVSYLDTPAATVGGKTFEAFRQLRRTRGTASSERSSHSERTKRQRKSPRGQSASEGRHINDGR
jgi:hypothetical protein